MEASEKARKPSRLRSRPSFTRPDALLNLSGDEQFLALDQIRCKTAVGGDMWSIQVIVERLLTLPDLVEDEDAGIPQIATQFVADHARVASGRGDEAAQQYFERGFLSRLRYIDGDDDDFRHALCSVSQFGSRVRKGCPLAPAKNTTISAGSSVV